MIKYNPVEYIHVDVETGEILTKEETKNYIKINQISKTKITYKNGNRNYWNTVTKHYRKNQQGKLF